ncbi:MAG: DUF6242 domain-containing protein [Prevotella sp.]|nr:DUF6242 domain-containing protein [Prevotella sp.]
MRLKIKALALLFSVVCVMSSCLGGDDTEYIVYDDTAISSVTLGTLKCYFHTKSKSGADSVYTGSVTGSSYPMYIDQQKREVYNVDSLPAGTDLAHVLMTVNTKNSGIPVLKSLTSDSIFTISNADSIDFSSPREIIVYSQSGKYSQKYTVSLSAHKEYADSFRWSRLADNTKIASYSKVKALAFGNDLYLLGTTSTKAELIKTATADGNSWSEVSLPASLSANASFVVGDASLYVADNETIYTSANGNSWTTTPAAGVKQLVGACEKELYAISLDGDIIVSLDGGNSWKNDVKDSDKANLPAQDISAIAKVTDTNSDVYRIVMIGNRLESDINKNDTACVVWSKIVETDKTKIQPWAYQEFESFNYKKLPCLSGLSATPYSDGLLAIGGKGLATCKNEGFTQIYYSIDCGITWHSDYRFTLPVGFSATNATIASDKDKYLWIISTGSGQVWRGRLNKLGWKKAPGYIGE